MRIIDIDIWLTNFLTSVGIWGYLLSCFCIMLESIIPILPLSVFITLLFYKFGVVLGFIISYIFTIIGCFLSYKIFNTKLRLKFDNYIDKKNRKRIKNLLRIIKRIKFNNLCLLIALPFTPAFLINIAAGLADIDEKKYLYSLLIGKTFLVMFWGLIGTSLINSIKNPINLVYIVIMLVCCFIISKLVEKREGIK